MKSLKVRGILMTLRDKVVVCIKLIIHMDKNLITAKGYEQMDKINKVNSSPSY